jgi:hypothetical protein
MDKFIQYASIKIKKDIIFAREWISYDLSCNLHNPVQYLNNLIK